MEHLVTSSVPPPVAKGRGKPLTYPFADMQVNDSFFTRSSAATVGPSARAYGKRHGMKFVCRTEGRGARVWRVA